MTLTHGRHRSDLHAMQTSTNRTAPARRWSRALTALLLLTVAVLPQACVGRNARLDEKFRHTISETFDEPPGVVVDLVDSTLETLRLRIMSQMVTSVDGRFEVRTAMGDDYRVVVEGLRTDLTRVAVDMTSARHSERARLILTEISSRIRSLRSGLESAEAQAKEL